MFVTNEQMLCLLYHEAKFNVVQGRYALYMEDYHRLAGLQVHSFCNFFVRFDFDDHVLHFCYLAQQCIVHNEITSQKHSPHETNTFLFHKPLEIASDQKRLIV